MPIQALYNKGFIEKCAEYGVDPDKLVKRADRLVRENIKAIPGDLISRGILSGLHPIAGGGSYLAGLTRTDGRASDYAESDENLSFAPFVKDYRMGLRRKLVTDESKKRGGKRAIGHLVSEEISPALLPAVTTVLGALAGGSRAALNDTGRSRNIRQGAIAGAALGYAPGAIGALAAAIKRRRTMQEQAEADASGKRLAAKWLIPGVATYDRYKRLSSSRNLIEDRKVSKSKPKKAKRNKA